VLRAERCHHVSRPMTTVVTGAASGIGAAIARRLVGAGRHVVGVDRRDATINADLADPKERLRVIDEIQLLSEGIVDGVVTFAGVGPTGRLPSELIATNYFGTVHLLEGLRPLLARSTIASALVASSNTITCHPNHVPSELITLCLDDDEERACRRADESFSSIVTYPATKIALSRWVRLHAVEVAWVGAGIRLNAIAPGMIDTPMVAERRTDPTLASGTDMSFVPVGRPGLPEEVAAFVEFLLGPEARFFCGSVLFCDGGSDAKLNGTHFPEFELP
jgi:NAD(P)-dependent dehydrogenase (short-subunit alcohol dehydrogenase family)